MRTGRTLRIEIIAQGVAISRTFDAETDDHPFAMSLEKLTRIAKQIRHGTGVTVRIFERQSEESEVKF